MRVANDTWAPTIAERSLNSERVVRRIRRDWDARWKAVSGKTFVVNRIAWCNRDEWGTSAVRAAREISLDEGPSEMEDPQEGDGVVYREAWDLVRWVRKWRLSSRQQAALEGLIAGKTKRQLAVELGISDVAVGNHCRGAAETIRRYLQSAGFDPEDLEPPRPAHQSREISS